MGTNIELPNVATKFSYKTWLHYINLAIKINRSFNQLQVELERENNAGNLLNLDIRLVWKHSFILAIVTNIEIAKIDMSFLAPYQKIH